MLSKIKSNAAARLLEEQQRAALEAAVAASGNASPSDEQQVLDADQEPETEPELEPEQEPETKENVDDIDEDNKARRIKLDQDESDGEENREVRQTQELQQDDSTTTSPRLKSRRGLVEELISNDETIEEQQQQGLNDAEDAVLSKSEDTNNNNNRIRTKLAIVEQSISNKSQKQQNLNLNNNNNNDNNLANNNNNNNNDDDDDEDHGQISDRKRTQDELLDIVELSRSRRLSEDSADSLGQFIRWSFAHVRDPAIQQKARIIRRDDDVVSNEILLDDEEDEVVNELNGEADTNWPQSRGNNNINLFRHRDSSTLNLLINQSEPNQLKSLARDHFESLGNQEPDAKRLRTSISQQNSAAIVRQHQQQNQVALSNGHAKTQMQQYRRSKSPTMQHQQATNSLLGNVVQQLHLQRQLQQQQQQQQQALDASPISSHLQQFLEQQRRRQQQDQQQQQAASSTLAEQEQPGSASQMALAAAIHRALVDSCQLPNGPGAAAPAGATPSSSSNRLSKLNNLDAKSTASSTTSSSSITTGGASSAGHSDIHALQQHATNLQINPATSTTTSTNQHQQHRHLTNNSNNNLHHLLALNDLNRLHQSQQRRIYNTRHSASVQQSLAAAAAAAVATSTPDISGVAVSNGLNGMNGLGSDQSAALQSVASQLTAQQQQLLVSAAAVASNRVQQQRHAQAAAALSALAASANQGPSNALNASATSASLRSSLQEQAAALINQVAVANGGPKGHQPFNNNQHQRTGNHLSNNQHQHPLAAALGHQQHHRQHQHQNSTNSSHFPQHLQSSTNNSNNNNNGNALVVPGGANVNSNIGGSNSIDFKCDICPSSFDDRHRLMQHQSIHLELKKEWFKETAVDEVMKIFNRRRGEFLCNLCNLRFEATLDYDQHNHEHHGARPYCCQFCGNGTRTFKCWRQYLNHLYDHRYIFSCTIDNCDFTVNRRDSLRFHIFRFHLNCQLPQQISPHHQLQQHTQQLKSASFTNLHNHHQHHHHHHLPQQLIVNHNLHHINNNNSILQANYNNNNNLGEITKKHLLHQQITSSRPTNLVIADELIMNQLNGHHDMDRDVDNEDVIRDDDDELESQSKWPHLNVDESSNLGDDEDRDENDEEFEMNVAD